VLANKRIYGFIIFLIVVFICYDVRATTNEEKCKDNCDWPWFSDCALYCSNQKIALGQRSFSNALIYIAWRKGFFHEVGLDIGVAYYKRSYRIINNIVEYQMGKPLFGLVNAGIAFGEMEKGAPIRSIFPIEVGLPYALVGAKKFSGVADLKGSKVGVPAYWGKYPQIYNALEAKGIKVYHYMDPSKALVGKAIDFGAVPARALPKATKSGFVFSAPIFELIPRFLTSTIVINKQYEVRNKKDFIRFSAAMLKATDFFYKNERETMAIVAKELAPTEFDEKGIKIVYDFYKTNNIFSRDGMITSEAFSPLQTSIEFKRAIDLSYVQKAKEKY
jgi:hypothetical protein